MAVCTQKHLLSVPFVRTMTALRATWKSYATKKGPNWMDLQGEQVPSVNVYLDTPQNSVNVYELFKGKKGVLFSVLGAFTPGCSEHHIPQYIENYDKFKEEGFDVIACVAVNDPFVMSAWAQTLDTKGKILMLADPSAEFTKALGMELDCRHIMGTVRSKRYSIVIENGLIRGFNQEPDHTGLACLLCIKNLQKTVKTRKL